MDEMPRLPRHRCATMPSAAASLQACRCALLHHHRGDRRSGCGACGARCGPGQSDRCVLRQPAYPALCGTYPQHTRSIVIDGVVPNELVVGGDFARTFEDAICPAVGAVPQGRYLQQALPDRYPCAAAQRGRDPARRAPVPVEYRDPAPTDPEGCADTGQRGGPGFCVFLRTQYASHCCRWFLMKPRTPLRAARLAGTRCEPQHGFPDQPRDALVGDREDAPRYHAPAEDPERLFGNEVASAFFAACPVWPHRPAPATDAVPLRSDVPALLLSGELDPVTPPRYAEQVLKGLPGRAWSPVGRAMAR